MNFLGKNHCVPKNNALKPLKGAITVLSDDLSLKY
jgi:hypothetical protein